LYCDCNILTNICFLPIIGYHRLTALSIVARQLGAQRTRNRKRKYSSQLLAAALAAVQQAQGANLLPAAIAPAFHALQTSSLDAHGAARAVKTQYPG